MRPFKKQANAVEGDEVESLTARRGGEIRIPNARLLYDATKFPRISQANEGNRRDLKKSRIPGDQILPIADAFFRVE